MLEEFDAVRAGERHVEHEEVRAEVRKRLDRFTGAADGDRAIADVLQDRHQDVPEVFLVVRNDNARLHDKP